MSGITNNDYINFFIMMFIIIGIFIYRNKRYEKYKKIDKEKLRYGIVISSIIMALPCSLVLEPPFLVYLLKNIFGVKSEKIYPILAIIAAVLFLKIIKFIYVPLNKDENNEEKK